MFEVLNGLIESEEKVCIVKGEGWGGDWTGERNLFSFYSFSFLYCISKEIKGWKMDWHSTRLMEHTIYLLF